MITPNEIHRVESYKKNSLFIYLSSLIFCFLSLSAGLKNFFSILSADMVYYHTEFNHSFSGWGWNLFGLLPLFLLFIYKNRLKNLVRWSRASLPLLLLFPITLLAGNKFFSLPLTLLVLGWTTFRFACLYGGISRKFFSKHSSFRGMAGSIPWLVALLYIGAVCWGFYMQYHAYRSFFLCYFDWGIYADAYMKLAYAGGNLGNWFSSGDHWNPGVNLLMALLMKACPLPEFIFLFNSTVIYSAAPLAYLLCRKLSLSPVYALLFAIAAILNPVYSNQSLSLFYGFHPINYMIPLLMLFFLFRETGNRIGMGIVFGLSLLVQETVFIFWIGYGVYLLFRRRWIPGTALILFSFSCFILITNIVLPRIVCTNTYPLTFLFDKLGNSPAEIALSPFLRPCTFWSICFQWQNFAFLLTLLTPFFFCIWLFPSLMIAVVPLLAGVCLRPSADVKSVVLQYGIDSMTLFLALAVINLRRTLDGDHSVLPGLLNIGLKKKFPRRVIAAAAVSATALTILGSYYCFGMTARFGKYTYRRIANLPDGTALIREIKSKIPAQSRILTTMRLRGHFLFEYPTEYFTAPRKTGDVLVLDLTDSNFDSPGKLEQVRREIAADPRIVPLLTIPGDFKQFVVFLVRETPQPGISLPKTGFAEFDKIGMHLPLTSRHFATRYLFDGKKHVFLVQVRETPDCDTDLKITIQSEFEVINRTYTFGFGLFPAYMSPPGTVFSFDLTAPPPKKVSIQFLKRPGSETPPSGQKKKETSTSPPRFSGQKF